jgi:uncharacterized protein (DUF1697 family)
MIKYASFLRGINVGNIRIKMPDLKKAFEELSFQNVKTYLQTGNIVFESKDAADIVKPMIEEQLSKTFHYEAYTIIRLWDSLAGLIAEYPFEKTEEAHAYIIFIDNTAILNELAGIAVELQEESKNIKIGQDVIYWKVIKGESTDTPFSKILSKKKYKSTTTVRNINTLEKMILE